MRTTWELVDPQPRQKKKKAAAQTTEKGQGETDPVASALLYCVPRQPIAGEPRYDTTKEGKGPSWEEAFGVENQLEFFKKREKLVHDGREWDTAIFGSGPTPWSWNSPVGWLPFHPWGPSPEWVLLCWRIGDDGKGYRIPLGPPGYTEPFHVPQNPEPDPEPAEKRMPVQPVQQQVRRKGGRVSALHTPSLSLAWHSTPLLTLPVHFVDFRRSRWSLLLERLPRTTMLLLKLRTRRLLKLRRSDVAHSE